MAIKVIAFEVFSHPDRLRRFEQEARAVAALNHPNILSVHDVGTEAGRALPGLRAAGRRGLAPAAGARGAAWAIGKDLVETSPCVGLSKPSPETQRDRVLTEDEIRALWAGCDAEPGIIADAFRLMLVSAQRRGEVLSMRWQDVDGCWWTIPAELAKNELAHARVSLDTFELAGGERVRLIGVDTAESVKPGEPVERFGPEASSFTEKMIEGKEVRLVFDVQTHDRYRRLLAYVYLKDGTFLNAELVRRGFATVMTVPPNVRHAEMFLNLQQEARAEKRGLWGSE